MGAWAKMGDNVIVMPELVRKHILSSYVCVLLCAFERKLKSCQASNKDFIDINVPLSIHLLSIQSKKHFQALLTLTRNNHSVHDVSSGLLLYSVWS